MKEFSLIVRRLILAVSNAFAIKFQLAKWGYR